jgi:hypothetical protein
MGRPALDPSIELHSLVNFELAWVPDGARLAIMEAFLAVDGRVDGWKQVPLSRRLVEAAIARRSTHAAALSAERRRPRGYEAGAGLGKRLDEGGHFEKVERLHGGRVLLRREERRRRGEERRREERRWREGVPEEIHKVPRSYIIAI